MSFLTDIYESVSMQSTHHYLTEVVTFFCPSFTVQANIYLCWSECDMQRKTEQGQSTHGQEQDEGPEAKEPTFISNFVQ